MPIIGVIASAAKGIGTAWTLLSTSYIGNNYNANYGFASSANVDGSGTVRWHRVNPQSSSSGYHNVWDGSSWVAKAIFNTSPGREIFGYGGSPNNSGTFVIAGGQASGSSTALDAFYYYYMTNNAWQYVGTLPGARRFVGNLVTGGYTTTNNNFLFGGVGTSNGSSTQVFNNNWRLEPAGGSWTTRTSHPLNYEWLPYSPHTRGVEGNVSTYRVHTLGGYSAPGGTYATQTSTLAHYGYQNSSDTWTTYTSFPGNAPAGTTTAPNIAGTADRIYSWDFNSPATLYTWNGSNWTAQSSTFSQPTGLSITSGQWSGFIDSSQKVTTNQNFYGLYQINKVS